MAQVTVSIAGRSYRMACTDGEEAHLQGLAAKIDSTIEEFRGSFGEIGDQRLLVMAAVAVADELAEANRKIDSLKKDIEALGEERDRMEAERSEWADTVASALESAAERMERMAKETK